MDVNTCCPGCAAPSTSFVRDGFFHRRDDAKYIQRFKCKQCGKKFSAATFSACYRQKKRRINSTVRFGFGSNLCPRDIAELVGVNIKTIAARLIWQAKLSREKNKLYIQALIREHGLISTVQLDDLVTFEHTNCKPLTVPMVVIDGLRVPLGFRIASIPAFSRLAPLARERYGKRQDNSRAARCELFEELVKILPERVHFKSDGHDHYATLIKGYFPKASHKVYPSKRGCAVAQGELKKLVFDPLFSCNHTFATLRAKVNRLNRRTWCTTKKPERLGDHIDIFIDVFCDRLKLLQLSPSAMRRQIGKAPVAS